LEQRVGLTPGSARELRAHGHELIVEACAGQGIGMDDDAYCRAGASIGATAAEVFGQAEMIVKVKEPQAAERKMLRPGQLLFTYLHLAPDAEQARDLIASGAVCIAYETVTSSSGGLPLLAPMSEVAGRMAIQAGAYFLEKAHGGLGVESGCVAAQAGLRRAGEKDEKRFGDRRRCHRSGRLLRDVSPDHARGSNLCRRRRDPLLCRQHARRSPAHLHVRAQQRDLAVCPRARRQGLEKSASRRSASEEWPERRGGQGHLQTGR